MMFSIVIPLYNKECAIRATLQSIHKQTYSSYEVIIVNDGSTDNSEHVVRTFIEENELGATWHLYNKANGGVSSARNLGLNYALSEYVAFLDGDDMWEPDYLAEQAKMIADFPEASLWSCAWGYMRSGEKIKVFHNPENYRGYIDNYWTMKKGTNIFCVCATIYRKSLLQQIGGYDERIFMGEDLDVNYRILLKGTAAFNSKYVGFYYVQDAENRAMNRSHPLDRILANHLDKYDGARQENPDFRRFFDGLVLASLYPYMLSGTNNERLHYLVSKIALNEQKRMTRLMIKCPHIYKITASVYMFVKKFGFK